MVVMSFTLTQGRNPWEIWQALYPPPPILMAQPLKKLCLGLPKAAGQVCLKTPTASLGKFGQTTSTDLKKKSKRFL